MLRIEYKGQPYDWFNLDDMGEIVRSDDFANTLRENIVHYFALPYDYQAIFDEEGMLHAPVDFTRSLQRLHPYFRVYDSRDLPSDVRDMAIRKLEAVMDGASRAQRALCMGQRGASGRDAGAYGAAASPCTGGGCVGAGAGLMGTPRGAVGGCRPSCYGNVPNGCGPGLASGGASDRSLSPRTAPAIPSGFGGAQQPASALGKGAGMAAQCNGCAAGLAVPANSYAMGGSVASAPGSCGGASRLGCGAPPPGPADAYEVRLVKAGPDDRYNFANVPTADGRALQVTWVDDAGLLGAWNRGSPRQVREGDIIVEVNGLCGDAEAMRMQLQHESICMVVHNTGAGNGQSRWTRA